MVGNRLGIVKPQAPSPATSCPCNHQPGLGLGPSTSRAGAQPDRVRLIAGGAPVGLAESGQTALRQAGSAGKLYWGKGLLPKGKGVGTARAFRSDARPPDPGREPRAATGRRAAR